MSVSVSRAEKNCVKKLEISFNAQGGDF